LILTGFPAIAAAVELVWLWRPSLHFRYVQASPMWCMFVYIRKRTNIYLDAGHLQKLKVLSEKTGAPVSALIRKAIEVYLKKIK
jgi:hypothetical protein